VSKKSPEKTNQGDIDNDEFFSQLKPPPKNKPLISPRSPEKSSSTIGNDPWASPTLTNANKSNVSRNETNAQLTSELDDLWANKNKIPSPKTQLNLNLDDPWSSSTTNVPNKLAPAIIPSANNPWSNSLATNVTNNSLENHDPWSAKEPITQNTPQTNNSIWPSLNDPSQQQSNTASLLTNNILNNLWTTTTSTNPLTNTASAFTAPIVRTNPPVNNPFLGNSIFPSTNLNGNSTLPNYSALSQPWLISSSITPSNTVTSSNKTTNPFLD